MERADDGAVPEGALVEGRAKVRAHVGHAGVLWFVGGER